MAARRGIPASGPPTPGSYTVAEAQMPDQAVDSGRFPVDIAVPGATPGQGVLAFPRNSVLPTTLVYAFAYIPSADTVRLTFQSPQVTANSGVIDWVFLLFD